MAPTSLNFITACSYFLYFRAAFPYALANMNQAKAKKPLSLFSESAIRRSLLIHVPPFSPPPPSPCVSFLPSSLGTENKCTCIRGESGGVAWFKIKTAAVTNRPVQPRIYGGAAARDFVAVAVDGKMQAVNLARNAFLLSPAGEPETRREKRY